MWLTLSAKIKIEKERERERDRERERAKERDREGWMLAPSKQASKGWMFIGICCVVTFRFGSRVTGLYAESTELLSDT